MSVRDKGTITELYGKEETLLHAGTKPGGEREGEHDILSSREGGCTECIYVY